jgi:hypothetical protein
MRQNDEWNYCSVSSSGSRTSGELKKIHGGELLCGLRDWRFEGKSKAIGVELKGNEENLHGSEDKLKASDEEMNVSEEI